MRFLVLCLFLCSACYSLSPRGVQALLQITWEQERRIGRLEGENRILREELVRRFQQGYGGSVTHPSGGQGDAGYAFPRTDAAVYIR